MKLKLDENGNAVLNDGKPVYVQDDGKEIAFDATQAMSKISQLNGEAKSHREAKEALQSELDKYKGIEDPDKAIEAIGKLNDLEAKNLIEAGEVDKVKAEMAKTYQQQLDDAEKEKEALQNRLYGEMIGGSFSRSKFIADNMAIPSDLAQSHFGKHFHVTDKGIVAKDASGNEIYSRKPETAGGLASFDEALEILVDSYPSKDTILKSSGMSGTGEQSPNGGNLATNPWSPKSFNMTEQGRIFKENPAQAKQMAAEYGIKLET